MTETTEPYGAGAGDEDLDTTDPELAERLHGWALDSIAASNEIRDLTARLTVAEVERDEARAAVDKMQLQISGWQDHLQRIHGIACDYGQRSWEPEDVEDTATPQTPPKEDTSDG